MVEPEAFIELPNRGGGRCSVCKHRDVTLYVKACLELTLKERIARPQCVVVWRRLRAVFEDRTPSESTVRRHLERCEPLWKETYLGEENTQS